MRSRDLLFRTALLAQTILALGCFLHPDSECFGNRAKCEDGVAYNCVWPDVEPHREWSTEDCTAQGLDCVDKRGYASCVLADRPCDPDANVDFCENDFALFCNEELELLTGPNCAQGLGICKQSYEGEYGSSATCSTIERPTCFGSYYTYCARDILYTCEAGAADESLALEEDCAAQGLKCLYDDVGKPSCSDTGTDIDNQ